MNREHKVFDMTMREIAIKSIQELKKDVTREDIQRSLTSQRVCVKGFANSMKAGGSPGNGLQADLGSLGAVRS